MALTTNEYHVGVAHSGEEAVSMARKNKYDIIFVDINMPAMNGLETYRAIREIDPELTAIMMTAYREEMKDTIKQGLLEHIHTCLYKPFEIDEALNLIDNIRILRFA